MSDLTINAGPFAFEARWEREDAPLTCEAFEALLPFRQKIIHVRWSGESAWIPLGDLDIGLDRPGRALALQLALEGERARGDREHQRSVGVNSRPTPGAGSWPRTRVRTTRACIVRPM